MYSFISFKDTIWGCILHLILFDEPYLNGAVFEIVAVIIAIEASFDGSWRDNFSFIPS